jgi:tellurite resistance protein TehA-like permease
MLDALKQVFLMSWLWSIFAGFYLVAYAFWVPGLFASLPLVVLVILVALALGVSLLIDGFSAATQLQTGRPSIAVPFARARQLAGGVALLSFSTVYLPRGGRVVAHWPLDLAITLVSAVILITYGLTGR